MANDHSHFTLGSHIRLGSLDFLSTEVDHNLVLLPPSAPVDHATGIEEGRTMLHPTRSIDLPSNINSIIELMNRLRLWAPLELPQSPRAISNFDSSECGSS
jgi:hypothetical protein